MPRLFPIAVLAASATLMLAAGCGGSNEASTPVKTTEVTMAKNFTIAAEYYWGKVENGAGNGQTVDPWGFYIMPSYKLSPAWELVARYGYVDSDGRGINLSDAQVWLWYRMREEASAARAAETGLTVIAKLDSGDPFLVEKKLGEGRVIQSAIPCDADWSNLPMRPFYLPLMQQVVTYLASKVHPPRNVEVGKALIAFLPAADAGKKAVMTDPDGRVHELAIAARGARAAVEFGRTQRPGLYVLDAPGSNRIHFVVNTDRKESDLRRLSDEQLDLVAKPMGATVVKSWNEYRQLDQQRRFGQEIWQALLGALIGLVFVEVLLEQYFARRKG